MGNWVGQGKEVKSESALQTEELAVGSVLKGTGWEDTVRSQALKSAISDASSVKWV